MVLNIKNLEAMDGTYMVGGIHNEEREFLKKSGVNYALG